MAGSFGPVQRIPQKVSTYWAPGAVGSDGVPSLAAPQQIMGRWTEKRTKVQTATMEQYVSNTLVLVDVDLEEGGYLAPGWHPGKEPFEVEEAQEIKGFQSTPDLRYMEQLRRAYL